ncbi:Por secretion system C-terminal sorting domain-containing protein [Daejeonella rubra]|uniref:Por secretion system C-terminal sorting domain-containing protein n=1 Tax=Daejeonella rubra TaxID=990371 RepID=A0A1G9NEP4_9SPHI|nr:T9SS type A sorting domain-containing protein [Daejeonella rubra]SDL84949.1 Por secretion system C-terminal sorting domain-containing protein [Daejeonella rubra]
MKHLILFLITGLLTQFAFAQDALLLKAPANGQVISGGDYFNISWESSNVDNIKIEYSLDGGLSWGTVINSYPSSASKYSWLVPAKPTTKGKIRISDIENSSIASVNPGNFIISEPELKLDADSSATLVKGNAFRFGWKSQTVEKVNMYYSTNGGTNYTLIRKGYPALAGSYTWIVPEINVNTIRLKIESSDSSTVSSTLNASIITNPVSSNRKFLGGSFDGHSAVSNSTPKLSLIFPSGNETFASSSLQTLKWDSNNIEYIKIEFSADNGISWLTINDAYPAYAKKLDWRVPSNNITNTGIIRVSSVEDPVLKSSNTIPFKIPLKSIALENPLETYYVKEQPIQISWVNNGVDFLSIKYRTNKGTPWKAITNSVSALMLNYIWIPPSTLTTDSLEFKISSTDNSVKDSSRSVLSIRAAVNSFSKFKGGSYDGFSQASNLKASIQIINPAAGTKLNGLSNTLITWKSENIEDINIHFSKNNGQSWTLINNNYSANAQKYTWEIPGTPTVAGLIKISSASDSTIKSISGIFEISDGFIKLTSDASTNGDVNSIIPISWTYSGISKLNIYFRQQTASSWTRIINNYQAAAESYLFINKQELSGLFDIKVASAEDPLIKDSIAINFDKRLNVGSTSKFKGGSYDGHASRSNISKILVTKPQAGEVLVAGTKYLITWSTVNVSDSVKIEYTTDNGKTWKTISVAVDSKSGSYQWTVPGSATEKSGQKQPKQGSIFSVSEFTNECKIRISETGSQDDVVGLSNNTFTISSTGSSAATQTITFNEITDKTFGAIPFAITATASSGLPVTFSIVSGPATISGNTITLTGTGTVVVKALQAGNVNYKEISAERTFKVLQGTQTLIFNEIADKTFGANPFTIIATASSGLPVTFSIVSGPASISGNTISLTGAGTVVVKALQAENTIFNQVSIERTFKVLPATQTLTFNEIADKTFGANPFTITATASSGQPVTFSIVSGPASISGNTITLTGAGTVVVKALQPGNVNYKEISAERTFRVLQGTQTLIFNEITDKTFGANPFTITATASSGQPVTFSIVSGPASISGNTITLTGAGTVVVKALQAGNVNYKEISAERTFRVLQGTQTLTFNEIADKTFGANPFTITATASSGQPVTFSIISGPATISGNTITLTGAGTVAVKAVQAGNISFNQVSLERTFKVLPATQTLTFNEITERALGAIPFTITATASSGLPVTFSIVSGPATISGNTITLTGAGTVIVRAVQAGNINNQEVSTERTFKVLQGTQTLTFNEIADKTFGANPFTVTATASSGLPVTFSIVTGPANISGNTITLTGAGTVVVKALQAGNVNYKEVSTERTFRVLQGTQTLIFNEIADKTFGAIPFTIIATSSSGLPVTFSIVSGPASISGNTITLTGAGTVVVKAVQAGNVNYQSAQELKTFRVSDMPVNNFMVRTISSTCVSSDNGKIEIKAEKRLNYTASVTGQGLNKTYPFTDSIGITNLKPGNYTICITVEGKKDYKQCYELIITEPKELKAYISIDRNTNFINLTLSGSTSYMIELNGKEYKTRQSYISFPLENGSNNIKISTDIPCQGVITQKIQGFSESLIYPSPFKDILKIDLREILSNTQIVITNTAGKTVYSAFSKKNGGILEIDLTHLIPGAYYVRLSTNDFVITNKVLKQ